MNRTRWLPSLKWGAVLGVVMAILVAAPPTWLDWRLNPGGLFHDDSGVHWSVLLDTFFSWAWPVFLLVAAPVSGVHYLRARREQH